MPVLSGFGAAKEIRSLLPKTPIVFFTMHAGEQFVSEAKKAGVQGFVAKDRAGDTLVKAVEAVLRNETFFNCPEDCRVYPASRVNVAGHQRLTTHGCIRREERFAP